jgi:general secretion pathway protein K
MMPKPLKNEKGVVLLITLLVVALCVALVVEINYDIRIKLNYATNYKDDLSAYYIAKSGVLAAQALLETDAQESSYDSMDELWAMTSSVPVPVGDGTLTLIIEDENKKINVNNLVRTSGAVYQRRMDMFLTFLEVMEIDNLDQIADEIVDWIDPDDEIGINGAEKYYYLTLDPPYDCKNDYLDSIQELKFVRSVNYEIFEKLEPFVSIYGGNDTKVNINTAPAELLMSLSLDITEDLAEEIIAYREEDTFTNKLQLRNVSGMDPNVVAEISPFIDVSSSAFLISSVGTVNETSKVIKAVVERDGNGKCSIVYWNVY